MRRSDLPRDPYAAAAHLIAAYGCLADQLVQVLVTSHHAAAENDCAADWYPVSWAIDELQREVLRPGEPLH